MTPFRQPQHSGSPKSECGRVCFDGPFESRPVTNRAIARPGERSNVTIAVRAARIIAVAQGCLGTAAAAVSDATLAPLRRVYSPPGPPGESPQGRVQVTPPYI